MPYLKPQNWAEYGCKAHFTVYNYSLYKMVRFSEIYMKKWAIAGVFIA